MSCAVSCCVSLTRRAEPRDELASLLEVVVALTLAALVLLSSLVEPFLALDPCPDFARLTFADPMLVALAISDEDSCAIPAEFSLRTQ